MPRLRNAATGVVVSCSEDTAARLGGDWRPVDEKPAKAPRARATRSSAAASEE